MHTPPTPTLRVATPADRPRVEALLVASALPLDGLTASLEGFVVAEDGDVLVGVAGLEPCGTHALLRSVAVDAARRAHGLGRALVARVIAEAERREVEALWLLTTTAAAYFPHFGFTTVARDAVPAAVRATAEFREACPASATVMTRPLRGAAPGT